LFLPESWCAATPAAKDRRERAHIPEEVIFRTKPQIAAELVRNVAALGQVGLDWVVADSEYGSEALGSPCSMAERRRVTSFIGEVAQPTVPARARAPWLESPRGPFQGRGSVLLQLTRPAFEGIDA
jgi:hypothetical protein